MVGLAFLSSLGSRGSGRLPEVPLGQPDVWQWDEGRKEPGSPCTCCWVVLTGQEPASPWYSRDVPHHQLPAEPIHHSQTYLQLSEPRPPQQRSEGWDGGVAGPGGPTRAARLGPSPQECPEGWAQGDTCGADIGCQCTQTCICSASRPEPCPRHGLHQKLGEPCALSPAVSPEQEHTASHHRVGQQCANGHGVNQGFQVKEKGQESCGEGKPFQPLSKAGSAAVATSVILS